MVSVGALGLIILGAAPMAVAQANPNADPILAESIAGSSAPLNFPAKGFQLTDQHGQLVSLASLRGKVVLLTFLDPVCTTDCPLIAQEFRAAGQLLGAASSRVELVAIVANPVYRRRRHPGVRPPGTPGPGAELAVPDRPLPQLQQVWKDYGDRRRDPARRLDDRPPRRGLRHRPDRADPREFSTDPGPGTAATKSSFAVLLADAVRQVLRSS